MEKNDCIAKYLAGFVAHKIWVDAWLPILADVGNDYFVCHQNDEERFYPFESVKCIQKIGGELRIYVDEPIP